ncbi:MAG: ergothioneine biosynthesis protein EgtC [Actinobacteria bacterium]|nr:ergothioneine biosynthesis protein EgtC [Actinomycetota bacterium]
MCRHLSYLGPPITLEALLLAPEHALVRQSYDAREMVSGKLNADGFGVGWYAFSVRTEPARYRRAVPMWHDQSFASFAGIVSSTAVVAAVRNATPGLPVEESGSAPFTSGPWLFSLNGFVRGFTADAGIELRSLLSARRLAGIEGASDSEVLFALALDRLDAGAPPTDALAAVVETVEKVSGGYLNLLLADGHTTAATTVGNTLYTIEDGSEVTVSSEPFDGRGGWTKVPDRSVVRATTDGLEVQAL